jgi:hypothetical protein
MRSAAYGKPLSTVASRFTETGGIAVHMIRGRMKDD